MKQECTHLIRNFTFFTIIYTVLIVVYIVILFLQKICELAKCYILFMQNISYSLCSLCFTALTKKLEKFLTEICASECVRPLSHSHV